MKVSVNWIKQLIDFELPPTDELVGKIGSQLGEVEEVTDLGKKYQGIIVAKVVSCVDHDNSDHLHVCKIDDGGKVQNVERDENGHVQVVCGAPNVREGLTVAWLPPGSTVPESFDKEPFVLETREIRGQKSNGMLASMRELALGDNHDGILEIDKDAAPGTDFAELYKLNDYIIDIENKMFTHRPDCFGALGVAREIAGVQQQKFTSPDWYTLDRHPELDSGSSTKSIVASDSSSDWIPDQAGNDNLKLEIRNEIPELVPRFMALPISNIEVKPSPIWLQVALAKVGQKSINNIVDLTNFYMLLTGQPLHAYDYDKVSTGILGARKAQEGETVALLNGKTIKLDPADMVITDGTKPIGLAGVMGGSETEVDENTRNIILECATFDMYTVRRTSMRHGLFTDAVTRFTKGQSPLQNDRVIKKIAQDISHLAGSPSIGKIVDHNQMEGKQSIHPPVAISTEFINARLGLKLSAEEMKNLLENVEFEVEVSESRHPELVSGSKREDESAADGNAWIPKQVRNDEEAEVVLTITAPFWRTDIEIPEDMVEEIGRLYGFDKLPLELPRRNITPAKKDELLELKSNIRNTLAKAGANEVLTYSFIHGNLLEKVGQNKESAFQLSNALSPGLQYYRLSVVPSLLEKVHPNLKAGYDQFALFELGKAHVLNEPDPEEPEIPKEVNALGYVYAAKKSEQGAAYYVAHKYLSNLLDGFQVADKIKLEPLSGADLYNNPWIIQMAAPFEPGRSAVLRDVTEGNYASGLIWGVVGEFKASVRKSLKLPDYTAGFEIDPTLLMYSEKQPQYVPLPRFPKVEQDISLKVAADLPYQELFDFIEDELAKIQPEETLPISTPIDIYQGDGKEHKHVTLRLTIASYAKTMRDAEVNELLDKIAAAAHEKFGAERL